MEKAALANNNVFVYKCEVTVKDIYNNTAKAIENATNLKNREFKSIPNQLQRRLLKT
jgi:hypothetical protein